MFYKKFIKERSRAIVRWGHGSKRLWEDGRDEHISRWEDRAGKKEVEAMKDNR